MATRKTLVEANSQHRPDDRWLVIGAPSKGILMLKIWLSVTAALLLVRMADTGFCDSAEMARRFYLVSPNSLICVSIRLTLAEDKSFSSHRLVWSREMVLTLSLTSYGGGTLSC